jgi:hypothetical protein
MAWTLRIRGWNECLITLFSPLPHLTRSSQKFIMRVGLKAQASLIVADFFFCHYSFCGLEPRELKDRYADYWQQKCSAHIDQLRTLSPKSQKT